MGMVKNKNRATVWTANAHLMPLLISLTGLSNAPIHWKNRATTIPEEMGRAGTVSTDGWVGRLAYRRILHQGALRQNISSL